jgi:hypothetical protein
MNDQRDYALKAIRPVLPLDGGATGEEEVFKNEVLRPILKLQNDVIVAIAEKCRDHYDPDLDLRAVLRDRALRDQLLGVVVGLFTLEELAFYLSHQRALDRRIMGMLMQRLEDQLGYVSPDTVV